MQFNVLKTQGGEMMLTLNHGASVYQTFFTAPSARQIAAALISTANQLDGIKLNEADESERILAENREWTIAIKAVWSLFMQQLPHLELLDDDEINELLVHIRLTRPDPNGSSLRLPPLKITETRWEYQGRRWEDDARRLMEALTPRPQSVDSLRVDRQHVEEIPALIEYGLIERRAKQPLLYQLTDSGRVMLAAWQEQRPTLDPLTEGLTDALQEIIEQPADTPVPPKSPFRKSFSWACDHLPTFAFRGYDFDMDDLRALRVTYLMPQTQMALEESGVNGGAVDYLVEGDWLERQKVAGFTAPFVCLTTKGEELLLIWNAAIEDAMKEAGA